MGETDKSFVQVGAYVFRLIEAEFSQYDPATRNCNHFSNKLSNYLCEKNIPGHLLNQNWMVIGGTAAVVAAAIGGSCSSSFGGRRNN